MKTRDILRQYSVLDLNHAISVSPAYNSPFLYAAMPPSLVFNCETLVKIGKNLLCLGNFLYICIVFLDNFA